MLEKLTGSLKSDNPSFMLNGVEDTEYKDVSAKPSHFSNATRTSPQLALVPHLSSCSQPVAHSPFQSQRPIPDVGPNDVLVNVKCTGICGSDIHCE
jgi:hypothetical protein